jgi:uncharacterized membrane protein SpoIIM required for sporulation
MLESMLSFRKINERPFLMFFWSFFICSIAIFISHELNMSVGVDGGFMVVVFTIIPSVFFITSFIKREEEMEEREIKRHLRVGFLGRHGKDILILLFFFFGLTAAFSLSYLFVSKGFYGSQSAKINQILGLSGQVTGLAAADKAAFMETIFLNNLNVMLFSFFFSFIFGAGAIFIITWNASVLGVRIGQLSESAWHIPLRTLPYLPHGVLEIGGYLCAGLAGGIISAAFIRKNDTKILKTISVDSVKVMLLGISLIFLGAAVEVYL